MVGCQEIGIAKGALAVEPASLPVAPLPPLATRLTVIVVTSPVHCHPSTELLDKVVESLGLLPQLDQCRLIVVADGGREATKYQPKAGKVPAATLAGYEQYLQGTNLMEIFWLEFWLEKPLNFWLEIPSTKKMLKNG